MSQPDHPRPPTRHPQKTFLQRLFSVFVAELMSFPAAFFLIETLELFCAEDHQINFVHQQRSVHWMVTTNKQRRLGWSLSPGWHRYRTWQEGRREWEEEGKKNNNLWAAAVVVCSFFGKLEAEERAECFDRCSRAYVEFCWGKICSHNVTHFPPAAPCTSALSSPPRTSAWRANNGACSWTDPSVRKGAFEKQIKADARHYTTLPWLKLQDSSWN